MENILPDDDGKKENDVLWDFMSQAGIANIDTYTEEEPFGMTNGRAIAKYLSRFRWYYPAGAEEKAAAAGENSTSSDKPTEATGLLPKSANAPQPPKASLDMAWHYFEHMVLPRRFCSEDGRRIKNAVDSVKAPAGEASRPTKLYNPVHTNMHELSDFGIGIGLYL